MSGSTITTFDAFLKERYTKEKIQNLIEADRVTWALLPKDGDCSGKVFVEPILIGNPQGLGATRAGAQAGAQQAGAGSNVQGREWNLTFGDYKASVEIGEKIIRASKDDPGSFLRNKAAEIDGLTSEFGNVMSTYLFSNGGQALGTGTISSGVITLTDKEAMANFALGELLQASADDGSDVSHTLLGSGSIGYVIAMSYEAGTVTVSTTSTGSAGTPSSWTGTMHFFRATDFGGAGATPIFKGFGGWIPGTAPGGSDSWYGVNRSVSDLLSGVRLSSADVSGLGYEQLIKKLVTRMTSRWMGPGPSHIIVNPERWQALADSMESRGTRPLDGKVGTISYSKLQVAMGGKNVEIISDRYCPLTKCYALKMDTWKLRSYGPVPDVFNGDGLQMLRKSTDDVYEYRLLAFPVLSTNAPSYNGVVTLPTAA
jgi:hypothetical protein